MTSIAIAQTVEVFIDHYCAKSCAAFLYCCTVEHTLHMVSTCWPPTPSSKIEVESNGYVSLFMFLMQELESAWSGGLLSSEGESFTSNQIIFRRTFHFMSNACECGQVDILRMTIWVGMGSTGQ